MIFGFPLPSLYNTEQCPSLHKRIVLSGIDMRLAELLVDVDLKNVEFALASTRFIGLITIS